MDCILLFPSDEYHLTVEGLGLGVSDGRFHVADDNTWVIEHHGTHQKQEALFKLHNTAFGHM